MSGFLGVLEAPVPVPHLQRLAGRVPDLSRRQTSVQQPSAGEPVPADLPVDARTLVACLSNSMEALLRRVGSQEQALRDVSEIAARMTGSAEKLRLAAEFIRSCRAGTAGAMRPAVSLQCRT